MSGSWIRMHQDNTDKAYSFPNPDVKRAQDAIWAARYSPSTLTRDQGFALAEICEAYWHLLRHPAKTEVVVQQLREVRQAFLDGKGGER